jgi:hypothetical protein
MGIAAKGFVEGILGIFGKISLGVVGFDCRLDALTGLTFAGAFHTPRFVSVTA